MSDNTQDPMIQIDNARSAVRAAEAAYLAQTATFDAVEGARTTLSELEAERARAEREAEAAAAAAVEERKREQAEREAEEERAARAELEAVPRRRLAELRANLPPAGARLTTLPTAALERVARTSLAIAREEVAAASYRDDVWRRSVVEIGSILDSLRDPGASYTDRFLPEPMNQQPEAQTALVLAAVRCALGAASWQGFKRAADRAGLSALISPAELATIAKAVSTTKGGLSIAPRSLTSPEASELSKARAAVAKAGDAHSAAVRNVQSLRTRDGRRQLEVEAAQERLAQISAEREKAEAALAELLDRLTASNVDIES